MKLRAPWANREDVPTADQAKRTDAAGSSGADRRDRPPIYLSPWQIILIVLLTMVFAVTLAPLSPFWWLVLLLPIAASAPTILAARSSTYRGTAVPSPQPEEKERQLLEALSKRGELTPATAALHTSLTIDEASELLDEMVAKGHLRARVIDEVMVYELFERDRLAMVQVSESAPELAPSQPATPPAADREPDGQKPIVTEVPPLIDPLSERELEVLRLLGSGRTNAEIAGDLFVATGTIKAHVNNIYRKLEVRNRTEALARARDLGLLD